VTVRTLEEIIADTRHLLLDFDGPVCSVFAGIPADTVARQLRDSLTAAGVALPAGIEDVDDPLEVFRQAASISPEAAVTAQQFLTAYETRAIPTAKPTEGSADLIIAAHRTRRTVAIVSNNSGAAIASYLTDHHLSQYVRAIVARDDHDPQRMKPSPYRVREAVALIGADSADCALVGDSTTDVLAGHLAGVTVIGYANKPAKATALTDAQAAFVTTDLANITAVLRAAPVCW
jgi:beta-phosphoglucomutase-like phosphatase (HAD superfamily)